MKTVTREDVKQVALQEISKNGNTTTLDVKNVLRSNGYWVTQEEVRNYMLDITSKDGEIEYIDGPSGYRIYKQALKTPSFTFGNGTSSGFVTIFSSNDGLNVGANHSLNMKQNSGPSLYKLGNFLVTDVLGRFPRLYKNVTRGKAKNMWAKEYNYHLFDARTRKVK
jgi:hypothetical protein